MVLINWTQNLNLVNSYASQDKILEKNKIKNYLIHVKC